MTIQEEARLSFYQKIADISDRSHVYLVQHTETKQIYVKKELTDFCRPVYEHLKNVDAHCFPKICELIESDGKLIIIEEYIQGKSLEAVCEESGRLSVAETKRYMLSLCRIVSFLHRQSPPVIHRDIKPSNVIISQSDGEMYLVDFNTSRYYEAQASKDTVVLGTKGYAAPEQYGFAQTDTRSDIYALGVTMNYLLTGSFPGQHTHKGVAQKIIEKCIQFEPGKRHQTVDALMRDLKNLPELLPDQSPPKKAETPAAPAKKDIRTNGFHWLPPGFRTGKAWKIAIAILGYAFLLFSGLTLEVYQVTPAVLSINRAFFLVIGFALIFFWFNYGDVHRILPVIKRKETGFRILGYILYSLGIVFVMICILTIIEMYE